MTPTPFSATHRPRPVSRPGGWPDEAEDRARLAPATEQLVALRSELDDLVADLSWLQITATTPPDLGTDPDSQP